MTDEFKPFEEKVIHWGETQTTNNTKRLVNITRYL